LIELLEMLFPKLEAVYANTYYGYDHLGKWRREGRICSPGIFERFFRLSIEEGDISRGEIEAILSLASNPTAFSEAVLRLSEDGRIVLFLERLEDYTRDQISPDNIEPIVAVLMDIGDLFPEVDGDSSYSTSMRVIRILYQLVHRFGSHDERFRILRSAIERADRSLYTMVHEVGVQGQQHGRYDGKPKSEPEGKLTVNGEQLNELEKLVCMKIEAWVDDGRLARSRDLPVILFSWQQWGGPERVKKFVEEMIRDDDGLVDFLAGCLSRSTSRGLDSYVGTIHWRIDLKFIGGFVDVKEIGPRVRDIAASPKFKKLDDREKLAISTFLDTVNGKTKDPFQDPD
jgi:predicted KAP-like P-loop ATPase